MAVFVFTQQRPWELNTHTHTQRSRSQEVIYTHMADWRLTLSGFIWLILREIECTFSRRCVNGQESGLLLASVSIHVCVIIPAVGIPRTDAAGGPWAPSASPLCAMHHPD